MKRLLNFPALLIFLLLIALIQGKVMGQSGHIENNSQVMVEMESAADLNGWTSGETTDSGKVIKYLHWTGEDFFNTPGKHILEYKINIKESGTYRFIWNTKVGKGDSPTDFNDTWLRIPDASDFYGNKNGHIVHPKGICKDDCPNGAGADGWFKVYSSGTVNWTWSTRTSDNDAHLIYARFDKPGIYTVQVSARSNGHFLNSFLIYKE